MTVEYTDFAINERNTSRVTQFSMKHYINIVFADINREEDTIRSYFMAIFFILLLFNDYISRLHGIAANVRSVLTVCRLLLLR